MKTTKSPFFALFRRIHNDAGPEGTDRRRHDAPEAAQAAESCRSGCRYAGNRGNLPSGTEALLQPATPREFRCRRPEDADHRLQPGNYGTGPATVAALAAAADLCQPVRPGRPAQPADAACRSARPATRTARRRHAAGDHTAGRRRGSLHGRHFLAARHPPAHADVRRPVVAAAGPRHRRSAGCPGRYFGRLLDAVIAGETGHKESAAQTLSALGIPPDAHLAAQVEAFAWASKIAIE